MTAKVRNPKIQLSFIVEFSFLILISLYSYCFVCNLMSVESETEQIIMKNKLQNNDEL